LHASIKSIGIEPPKLERNYKKRPRPVDGYGKYINVLPTNYTPPRSYEFPRPTVERAQHIREACEKTRKKRKKVSPRVWTTEKVERLKSLYAEGRTQQAIADELGMSKTAVNAEIHILQEKGELVKTKDQRPWTDAEITELRRLRDKGLSFDECGKRLGRHPASCSGVLRRLKKKC
jgi:DNA-binding CsgD family transcriptional regulator